MDELIQDFIRRHDSTWTRESVEQFVCEGDCLDNVGRPHRNPTRGCSHVWETVDAVFLHIREEERIRAQILSELKGVDQG